MTPPGEGDGDVWVLAEHRAGEVLPVTFELLQEVGPLARALGERTVAVLPGVGESGEVCAALAHHGADGVAYAPGSEDPGRLAGALAEACRRHRPSHLVLPATSAGRELAARLAAELSVGLVPGCLKLELGPDRSFQGTRELYGGYATEACFGRRPHLFTFKPGAAGLGRPDRSRSAAVVALGLELPPEDPRTRVLEVVPADPRTLDLADAEAIVAAGRGAGSAEAVAALQELADALGAGLGGTRVAADLGWIPRERFIGLSGKKVSPRLYLAAGVGGGSYHAAGLRGAESVVAINVDEGAEIFRRAELGAVGDLRAVVPLLLGKIRAYLGLLALLLLVLASPGEAPAASPAACAGCHPEQAARPGLLAALSPLTAALHAKQDPTRAPDRGDCLGCHPGHGAGGHAPAAGGERRCAGCHSPMRDGGPTGALLGRFHGRSALPLVDLLLALAAAGACAEGLRRVRRRYLGGRPEARTGRFARVLRYLLGHRRLLRDRRAGTAHLLLFWGFATTLLLTALAGLRVTLPGGLAAAASLVRDLAGLACLVGAGYFLARRLGRSEPAAEGRDLLPVVLLLLALTSGFAAAGVRIRLAGTEAVLRSPVGSLASLAVPGSPLLLRAAVRLHFLAVLSLVAVLPFTRLRHLWATAVNVYYGREGALTAIGTPALGVAPLGARAGAEFSWKHLLDAEACTSCGRCDASCPAARAGSELRPRRIVQGVWEPVEESRLEAAAEPLWACTICGACNAECPAEVDVVAKVIELRRHRVERGHLPASAHGVLESLALRGNPWLAGRDERFAWAEGLPGVARSRGRSAEWLYWVGCTGAYVSAAQRTSRVVAELLERAGLAYRVLGPEEACCGEPARRIGEEGLFQELGRRNVRLLDGQGVRKIVTPCPHCYYTLKHEYPALGGRYEVLHHAALLARLVAEGRLSPAPGRYARVFFQDPCTLTRFDGQAGGADALLAGALPARLPGGEPSGSSSCCGGGGGQPWLDAGSGPRVENARLEEILRLEPDAVATACPFCRLMLESAASALGVPAPPVRDVAELLAEPA